MNYCHIEGYGLKDLDIVWPRDIVTCARRSFIQLENGSCVPCTNYEIAERFVGRDFVPLRPHLEKHRGEDIASQRYEDKGPTS